MIDDGGHYRRLETERPDFSDGRVVSESAIHE
jgi:hypothetical protein